MKKIVIFDMDGTLIDSKKDITISINYVRKLHHNLPPLSEDFIVEAINMHERNLPKMFYNTEIYQKPDRDLFELHYEKQCVQNPYLYDGIEQTLKELVSCGIQLSVATNAPTKFAQRMLSSLKVDNFFDMIIGADKVKHSKPDPQMINNILDYYNYNKDSNQAWMVGDNSKDMQSAKEAGIHSLFATWGFSTQSDYEYIVSSPKEIIDIVL